MKKKKIEFHLLSENIPDQYGVFYKSKFIGSVKYNDNKYIISNSIGIVIREDNLEDKKDLLNIARKTFKRHYKGFYLDAYWDITFDMINICNDLNSCCEWDSGLDIVKYKDRLDELEKSIIALKELVDKR